MQLSKPIFAVLANIESFALDLRPILVPPDRILSRVVLDLVVIYLKFVVSIKGNLEGTLGSIPIVYQYFRLIS
jgi:hypothetical protein